MMTFDVQGMSCGHCVGAVTEAVKALDAAATVKVDLASGRVEVQSSAPADSIKAAIEGAGYEVGTPA